MLPGSAACCAALGHCSPRGAPPLSAATVMADVCLPPACSCQPTQAGVATLALECIKQRALQWTGQRNELRRSVWLPSGGRFRSLVHELAQPRLCTARSSTASFSTAMMRQYGHLDAAPAVDGTAAAAADTLHSLSSGCRCRLIDRNAAIATQAFNTFCGPGILRRRSRQLCCPPPALKGAQCSRLSIARLLAHRRAVPRWYWRRGAAAAAGVSWPPPLA